MKRNKTTFSSFILLLKPKEGIRMALGIVFLQHLITPGDSLLWIFWIKNAQRSLLHFAAELLNSLFSNRRPGVTKGIFPLKKKTERLNVFYETNLQRRESFRLSSTNYLYTEMKVTRILRIIRDGMCHCRNIIWHRGIVSLSHIV